MHFSVELWSRFLPPDLLSGCGPAQERQGVKATCVQKTDPHTTGCGEHTRGTLVGTIQRSCSISLSMISCVFCFPTEHLRGEVQELWGVQGWRSAYSSQHSHSARRWGLLYRSHQCDLWNSMCTLNSSVNLTDSTFSVNSKQRSDWNCKTSLQRHMPWGQTEQTVGILSLFNALDMFKLCCLCFWQPSYVNNV